MTDIIFIRLRGCSYESADRTLENIFCDKMDSVIVLEVTGHYLKCAQMRGFRGHIFFHCRCFILCRKDTSRQMILLGIFYTVEIAYRSRSEYSARPWGKKSRVFSEGVNNLAVELSCPIHWIQASNQDGVSYFEKSRPRRLQKLPFHSIGSVTVIEMTHNR